MRLGLTTIVIAAALQCGTIAATAQPVTTDTKNLNSKALLDGFRHVEVASISDAVEQVAGERTYMSHRMHAISSGRFVGFAVTVALIKDEGSDASATKPMQAAIDTGAPDSVYVMTVQDGANIAGIGGLMATAMNARRFAGAVIDGGVRDVAYLRKMGFPVYGTGIVPSTSVGHYRATRSTPVTCDGVLVRPGDIVAGDGDGVVVIPLEIATEVLQRAQKLDYAEHSMYGTIEELHSLEATVEKFGRL